MIAVCINFNLWKEEVDPFFSIFFDVREMIDCSSEQRIITRTCNCIIMFWYRTSYLPVQVREEASHHHDFVYLLIAGAQFGENKSEPVNCVS